MLFSLPTPGSNRIPLQTAKCPSQNTTNSTFLSMNSFNNNNINLNANSNANNNGMALDDSLLLHQTTPNPIIQQKWTTNKNGNNRSVSWQPNRCTFNLDLNTNHHHNNSCSSANNSNGSDLAVSSNQIKEITNGKKLFDQTPVSAEESDNNKNSQVTLQSPYECGTRYRKTWI